MSIEKSDHDLLTETHTNVEWLMRWTQNHLSHHTKWEKWLVGGLVTLVVALLLAVIVR
jgi:hypothetical protein